MLPWNVEDLTFDATRFTGSVRLFPLPDLVMFPYVVQPLHVFEPRYRDMLNDALDGDGLIAMSILAPGWESDYEGRPALLPQICVGKVVTHHRLDDGCYNLMLLGMRRGRILSERPAVHTFRQADVELIDDFYSCDGHADRRDLQMALADRFQQELSIAKTAPSARAVQQLLSSDVPLGVLTDLVSFALPLNSELKWELLAEGDIDRRARLLLESLGGTLPSKAPVASAAHGKFPPRFSAN